MICEQVAEYFLFPNNLDNHNKFTAYCNNVDHILNSERLKVLPYTRQDFAYFSIWLLHGYQFPIPLSTASVIISINKLLNKYIRGVIKVSSPIYQYI